MKYVDYKIIRDYELGVHVAEGWHPISVHVVTDHSYQQSFSRLDSAGNSVYENVPTSTQRIELLIGRGEVAGAIYGD